LQTVKNAFFQNVFTDFRNLYDPCTAIRLFLDELIPSYDSVLYVDSDIIFLQNVEKLWEEFQEFSPSAWAGFGPDQYGIVFKHLSNFYGNRGLNAGVSFLNLTRMRNTNFSRDVMQIQSINGDLRFGEQVKHIFECCTTPFR